MFSFTIFEIQKGDHEFCLNYLRIIWSKRCSFESNHPRFIRAQRTCFFFKWISVLFCFFVHFQNCLYVCFNVNNCKNLFLLARPINYMNIFILVWCFSQSIFYFAGFFFHWKNVCHLSYKLFRFLFLMSILWFELVCLKSLTNLFKNLNGEKVLTLVASAVESVFFPWKIIFVNNLWRS